MQVFDTQQRALGDLRISVTDRCNFRCRYCMPREAFGADHPFLPRADVLTFEEIARVAGVFSSLGVRKFRLTGGEPLVRAELPALVKMLAAVGDADIALTTNGALLAKHAEALASAGLARVTVSLDAVDDATFQAMTDSDVPVERVLEGIDSAARAGLSPVKVNCVVKRGMNEHAIVDLAERFRGTSVIVRFIEFMDVGITNGWRMDDVVPAAEIVRRIDERHPLEPVPSARPSDVARRWRYRDGAGEVGVIASVTAPFCDQCTRARLSADGKLYACLFSSVGTDLRGLLRSKATDDDLRRFVTDLWRARADRYSQLRSNRTKGLPRVEMSFIGG